VIRPVEIDPRVLELRQLFKEYKARREVKPENIELYVERHLIDKKQIKATDFTIECIEDYICFSYLRPLRSLGKKGRGTANKYEIKSEDNYVNVADMVECRDFSIQRKG